MEIPCNSYLTSGGRLVMQQLRKIVTGILIYVLLLAFLPGGIWTGTAKAASALSKVKVNTPYYVTGGSQYKNKTFLLGRKGTESTNWDTLSVINGTKTQTIIPNTVLKLNESLMVDTGDKLFISPQFPKYYNENYGFVVDKNTYKYQKMSLKQMYAPFMKFVSDRGYTIDTFYNPLTVKSKISWIPMNIINNKTQDYQFAVVNSNGKGKIFTSNGQGSPDVDTNGNLFIPYCTTDNSGQSNWKLIKIDLSGKETDFDLSRIGNYSNVNSINFFIDKNNYFYLQSGNTLKIATLKGSSLQVKKTLNVTAQFDDNNKNVWYEQDNSSNSGITYGYFNSSFGLTPKLITNSTNYASRVNGVSMYGSNIFAYNSVNYALLINMPADAPKVSSVTDHVNVVKGTAEPGSKITVVVGKKKYYATAGTNGAFIVKLPVQKGGTVLSITATNKSNYASKFVKITVKDNTPPAAPKVNKVKKGNKVVTGTAEPGATVSVKIGPKLYKATVKSNKTFTVKIPAVSAKTLSVTAKDKAGNVSKAVTVVVSR
jgi:hypothetical protein